MNKQEKHQRVDALREELAGLDGLLVAEYRGTSVAGVQALRAAVRKADGQVRVVKNTLARLSIQGTALEAVSDKLVGPVLITYGKDLAGAAKAIVTVAKDVPTLVVTGGVISGKALAPAQVEALSKLPGKDALRSSLLGTMNAVPTKLVGTMAGVPRGFLNVLNARKEKLEQAA